MHRDVGRASESDFADYFECGYKVYIGPKKYFVTSDVGDGRVQWYSFLAQPPGTNRAGDSWEVRLNVHTMSIHANANGHGPGKN